MSLHFNVRRPNMRNEWRRLRVARHRGQEGWVEERGKRRKRWYGHYYIYERDSTGQETRRHVGIALGEKAGLLKCEAVKKLRRLIELAAAVDEQIRKMVTEQNLGAAEQDALKAEVNSILAADADPERAAARAMNFLNKRVQPAPEHLTLGWFTRERFVPMKWARWAPSTRATNQYNIERHILPALGASVISKLDKFQCQIFLNKLAGDGFSFTVVDHNRTMVKAILEEALEAELIGKNPARKLEMPETRESQKFVLPKDQARVLLEALPFRDRLMAMVAAFCAMRPGEIFGLRWTSWREDYFQIEGTAWRGTLRPGKTKTKGSKAPVVIPDVLIPALKMWRAQNIAAPAEALIFPSEKGTPLRPENWLRRHIKPIAEKLKITVPVNFQVLRRTFATHAEGYGNPRDVMAHLRHSDIATTLNVYSQPVAESVRKLVNAVTQDVMTAELPAIPEPVTRRIQ
jgi:integrase